MSKHYGVIASLLGVALISVLLWGTLATGLKLGKIKSENTYHIIRYAEQASDQINKVCLTEQADDLPDCVAGVINATNENQRAQKDLEAQMEMALWAFWMLIITVIMAIITGLGVFFVWRTLIATQHMASDTTRIGEAQVRAYVNVSCIHLRMSKDGVMSFNIAFENSGNSPARRINAHAEVNVAYNEVSNEGDVLVSSVGGKFPDIFVEQRNISAGCSQTEIFDLVPGSPERTIDLLTEMSTKANEPRTHVEISIHFSYFDVFDRKRNGYAAAHEIRNTDASTVRLPPWSSVMAISVSRDN